MMLQRYTIDNPNHRVDSYDESLHQSLGKIFAEYERGERSQDFLVGSQHNSRRNSKQKLKLLAKEPILSRHFTRQELGKLSLLWIAILAGYKRSAELLVRYGADVDERFGSHNPQVIDEKWTVLHVLLQMDLSYEKLIYEITKRDADLQAQDSKGQNVLHFALTKDRVQMAELLLEKRTADLQARDFYGQTVLHVAVAKARVQMTEMLLKKGADANVADNTGMTPLLKAASSSKLDELLPLLMRHGADIFARSHGNNILHLLTLAPDIKHAVHLAKVMIEKGVSLDDREHAALYQPIHKASMAGHNELVKLYLDHGADVNSLTSDDVTPLHLAARNRGTPAVLETMLEHGAKVDRISFEGRTALHVACEYANCEGIRVLATAGADMFSKDRDGKTPFALLMNRQYMDEPSIRLMLKLLALKKVCLRPSSELGDEQIIKDRKLSNYYQDCIEQIERTKSTSLVRRCSFFDILTKCHCQISALMRNPKLESEFDFRYDMKKSEFATYAEDVFRAFERARRHYHSILEQEDVINVAVHGILPYMVVKRVAQLVFNDRCSCKN